MLNKATNSSKYENETLKMTRNAFNVVEVWNSVCCHGKKPVTAKNQTFLIQPAEIHASFFITFDQNRSPGRGRERTLGTRLKISLSV